MTNGFGGTHEDNEYRQGYMQMIREKESAYDSTEDTMKHITRIRELLAEACEELTTRGEVHDQSKLEDPEKSTFDEYTPKLKGSTYGSNEYKGFLKGMDVALKHHYANNSHHPEHYENGINDMDVFDIIEMIIDWKAASERHGDGNIMDSIATNKDRFDMSDQLVAIYENTAINMGWAEKGNSNAK